MFEFFIDRQTLLFILRSHLSFVLLVYRIVFLPLDARLRCDFSYAPFRGFAIYLGKFFRGTRTSGIINEKDTECGKLFCQISILLKTLKQKQLKRLNCNSLAFFFLTFVLYGRNH